ncbi:MAG: PHP domain-containing protein [Candidatus Odinarchaeum yellowstonii]|uniref:PHP domain-containing protein n=1 Tax=Odinarchaeota yellowstonii (strain LCB_4) TaxID=1841599 RepID=A0AAF0IBN4_ODILC|nr:MAG: PHP domain-containing protein [Candidatus Odinarchaeum yellowstonii]
MHSQVSPCSKLTLQEILELASSYNLDGVVLTDHNAIGELSEEIKEAEKHGLTVFLGYELTVLEGELLIYGLNNVLQPYTPAKVIIKAVHSAGGVVVAAHPFRSWPVQLGEKLYDLDVDGVEVSDRSRLKIDERALTIALKKHIAATAGSDAHHISEFGWCCTEFFDRIENISQLVDALKKQRCKPKIIR